MCEIRLSERRIETEFLKLWHFQLKVLTWAVNVARCWLRRSIWFFRLFCAFGMVRECFRCHISTQWQIQSALKSCPNGFQNMPLRCCILLALDAINLLTCQRSDGEVDLFDPACQSTRVNSLRRETFNGEWGRTCYIRLRRITQKNFDRLLHSPICRVLNCVRKSVPTSCKTHRKVAHTCLT